MADISVNNMPELSQALKVASPGTTILVQGGNYLVTEPLKVPDGVTLEGKGGWGGGTGQVTGPLKSPIFAGLAALRATGNWKGDLLTLGAGARLVGLFIADAKEREGNLLVLSSTGADSEAAAAIEHCELRNPTRPRMAPEGPIGRAILLVTRSGHDRSRLKLTVKDCSIRSSLSGTGVFAANFASDSGLFVQLTHNRIGGGLDASGGVSRPASVSNSEVVIDSKDNLYCWEGESAGGTGWSLHGGANPPSQGIQAGATSGNRATLGSRNDAIEGFVLGVNAVGGLRPFKESATQAHGPVNGNRTELALDGTTISSGELDFLLSGARSGSGEETPDFSPGDDNQVRLFLRKLKWIDKRNLYDHILTAAGNKVPPTMAGTANQLSFGPSLASFVRDNEIDDAAPAATYFG